MSELTKQGYNMIFDRIEKLTVAPPTGLTAYEMQIWISAYAKAQNDILDLIIKLKETNGR